MVLCGCPLFILLPKVWLLSWIKFVLDGMVGVSLCKDWRYALSGNEIFLLIGASLTISVRKFDNAEFMIKPYSSFFFGDRPSSWVWIAFSSFSIS